MKIEKDSLGGDRGDTKRAIAKQKKKEIAGKIKISKLHKAKAHGEAWDKFIKR